MISQVSPDKNKNQLLVFYGTSLKVLILNLFPEKLKATYLLFFKR